MKPVKAWVLLGDDGEIYFCRGDAHVTKTKRNAKWTSISKVARVEIREIKEKK